ncbi:MAG: ATP-binding protein [bacterium]
MEKINPFVYDRALDQEKDKAVSIIRKAEIDDVIIGLKRGNYFSLLAPNHTGKTTFIYQLMGEINKDNHLHYYSIYINFEKIKDYNLETFYQHLAQYIIFHVRKKGLGGMTGGTIIRNASLFRYFLENIASKIDSKILFLLDGIEILPKEIARELLLVLRTIYNESTINPSYSKINILISGTVDLFELTIGQDDKTSPFNIAKPIILRDFRKEEVLVFIQQLEIFGIKITPDCVNRLYEITKGHPYLVQKICYILFDTAQRKLKQGIEHITMEEFKESVEQIGMDEDETFTFLTLKIERDLEKDLELLKILETLLYDKEDIYIVGQWDASFRKLELSGIIIRDGNKIKIRTPLYKDILKRHFTKEYFARIYIRKKEYGKASIDFKDYYDNMKQDELKNVARISQMQVGLITNVTISMLNKLPLDTILKNILEAIVKYFNFERSYLYLIDRKEGKLKCDQIVDSENQISKDKFWIDLTQKIERKPHLVEVILEGQDYFNPDIEEDAKTDSFLKLQFGEKGSVLAIPLVNENKSLGILAVYNSNSPISETDRNFISFLTEQITLMIKHKTICEQLHILNEISKIISSDKEFSTILSQIVKKVFEGINVAECAFFELKDGRLKIKSDINWSQASEYKLGDGVIGIVGRERKSHKISKINGNGEELAVPSEFEGNTVGVLAVQSVIPNSFDNDDMEFLSIVGEQIGMVVNEEEMVEKVNQKYNKIYEERLKREMERLESERLISIGELADRAAHEISNPLSTIKGLSGLLLKKEPQNEDLRRIQLATDQAQMVIDGLQEAKISAPHLRPIDINTIINDALGQLKQELHQYSITPSIVLAPDLPPVNADQLQLGQVFINIIKNAIQSMSKGGSLEVKTFPPTDDFVKVEISDTGGGIPEKDINQIFNPFFTRGSHKGKGLGLWICRGIIKEHKGNIKVDSKEGEGTTFTIKLPV